MSLPEPNRTNSTVGVPNTFIIGAPKCGTSAMAAYLKEHPNVFVCEPKEPFFWSEDYPLLRQKHKMTDQDRYLRLFNDATESHSVICEGSTNYLASSVAVERIMEFNPDAKFLVMLRNPVEVVHAFHSEILFSYIENEPDFEKAWRMQDQRLAGMAIPDDCCAPQFLQYRDVASYAPQLKRFFALVPEANREVMIFDDFKADNSSAFQSVIQFLGLPEFKKDSFERVNASHDHKYPAFSKLVLDPPTPLKPFIESVRFAARRFKGGWIDQAKHWFRKPSQRTPLSPEFRAELTEFFSNDIQATSELLKRNLSHWLGRSSNDASVVTAEINQPIPSELHT